MSTFLDSLLDLIVDFIPWPPTAWDVVLTRSKQAPWHLSVWSEQARRWVTL